MSHRSDGRPQAEWRGLPQKSRRVKFQMTRMAIPTTATAAMTILKGFLRHARFADPL